MTGIVISILLGLNAVTGALYMRSRSRVKVLEGDVKGLRIELAGAEGKLKNLVGLCDKFIEKADATSRGDYQFFELPDDTKKSDPNSGVVSKPD